MRIPVILSDAQADRAFGVLAITLVVYLLIYALVKMDIADTGGKQTEKVAGVVGTVIFAVFVVGGCLLSIIQSLVP